MATAAGERRRAQEGKKDDKGWLGLLGLLGLLGGVAWAAFGKKGPPPPPPPGGPSLEALSVVFNSPGDFFPGSWHTARVTLKNSGTAPTAVGGSGNINIIPDVGVIDLSSLLLMPIAPGATVEAIRDFSISPLAVPGSQNVWTLSINYDGQTLQAQGDAFMVEMPPAPFLQLLPPVLFT